MNGFFFQQTNEDLLTTYRGLVLEAMIPQRPIAAVNETQKYLEAVMLELDSRGINFGAEHLNIVKEFGWK